MALRVDISSWILTKLFSLSSFNPDDERLYYGRILTVRFLAGYVVSFLLIYHVWRVQGFKSFKTTVRMFIGYVIFLVLLSLYMMDTEQLYDDYWYDEHLGKLVVWYKLSEVVLDVFTMSQCTLPDREDLRAIGGYAAMSYSLDFIQIILIWCGATV